MNARSTTVHARLRQVSRPRDPRRLAPLLLALILVAAGCRQDREAELHRLAPGLGARSARSLAGSDRAFARVCDESPSETLMAMLSAVSWAPATLDSARFAAEQPVRRRYRDRVCDCLSRREGFETYVGRQRALSRVPFETARELRRLKEVSDRLAADTTLAADVRMARMEDHIREVERFGDYLDAAPEWNVVADLALELGRSEAQLDARRQAVREAHRSGNPRLVCQYLPVYALAMANAGVADSVLVLYQRALDLAMRCRLPSQIARITAFLAADAANGGRVAAAHDLLRLAVEGCANDRGDRFALAAELELLTFYARIHCWNMVERGFRALPALQRLHRENGSPRDIEVLGARLDALRGELLLARGNVEASAKPYRRAEAVFRGFGTRPVPLVRLRVMRGEGLLRAGRIEEALALAEEAVSACRDKHIPELEGAALAIAADAHAALGDTTAATAMLDAFDAWARLNDGLVGMLRPRADALRIRLASNPAARVGALRSAFADFRACLGGTEPTTEGYIRLTGFLPVVRALRDLAAGDPAIGYQVEMETRRAASRLGDERESATWSRGLEGALEAAVAASDAYSGAVVDLPANAIHVLFAVDGGTVIRWTATADGVRRETLAAGLESRVARLVERLRVPPENKAGPVESGLLGELHDLAAALLPPEALAPGRSPSTLYVTAEGALGLLPFDALSTDGAVYRPLLASRDVVIWRPARAATAPAAPGALIVASPAIGARTVRLHAGLDPLPGADAEAAAVHALLADARLLTGDAATREALLAALPGVGFAHVAAHVVRDPSVPFATFLPLASTGDRPETESYLEVGDIRSLRLDGLRLAVLAGCATGEPYVEEGVEAPSLGDAFIDAGARAVVETAWAVRDDVTRALMTEFVERIASGASPEVALAEVKRRLALDGEVAAHPYAWAAFQVTVAEPATGGPSPLAANPND